MRDDDSTHAHIQSLALTLGFQPLALRHPDHDLLERDCRLFEILHLSPVNRYYMLERRAKRITRDEYRLSSNRTVVMLEADHRAETTDPAVSDATHDAYVALLERMRATPEWADLLAQRTSSALDDRACLDAWYALIDAMPAAT